MLWLFNKLDSTIGCSYYSEEESGHLNEYPTNPDSGMVFETS